MPKVKGKPAIFNVPIPRNPFFTGRDDILAKLHEALHDHQEIVIKAAKPKATAINGLGGVGKTQTAAEYAYRYQSDYSAVLWVSADSVEMLNTSFAQLAPLLGSKAEKLDEQILAVKSWLAEHQGWLVIFDNAETASLLEAARKLLPINPMGHVLFTTRAQATGNIAALELGCFDDETGAVLLLRRCKRVEMGIEDVAVIREQLPGDEWQTATTLTHELGGLALAIDQAGAYIEQTDCGLAGYLDRFRNSSAEILKHYGIDDEHPRSVYQTFLLAWRKAQERHPLVDDILCMSAFLHPDGIPEEIFASYEPLELDKALAALKDYSLINRLMAERLFTVHRLVQIVVRDVHHG